MLKVIMKPELVWEFFQMNSDRLSKESFVVARNDETKHALCLKAINSKAGGKQIPEIYVLRDGKDIFEEVVVSESDCKYVVSSAIKKYMSECEVSTTSKKEKSTPSVAIRRTSDDELKSDQIFYESGLTDDDERSIEEIIEDREEELKYASLDFLEILLNKDPRVIEKEMGEDDLLTFVDDVCVYVLEKLGWSIYRPSWIEDEKGDLFTSYPYDHY